MIKVYICTSEFVSFKHIQYSTFMFLLMSVILSRGGVLSQHALQVVSQHALQHVSGGLPAPERVPAYGRCLVCGVPAPRGHLVQGVAWLGGVAFCYGLLLWPSGLVAFWCGLLVWWSSD